MTDDIAGIDDTDGIGNFNVVRFPLNQLIATRSIQPMKISKQETNKNLYKDQTRLYANWEVDVLGPIGSGFRSVGSRIQNEEYPVLGLYIAKASCG